MGKIHHTDKLLADRSCLIVSDDVFVFQWKLSSSSPVLYVNTGKNSLSEGNDLDGTSRLWHTGFMANEHVLKQQQRMPPNASIVELFSNLYEQYGNRIAQQIFGSLTFIFWDHERQELIAARDRIGNYSIYYVRYNNAFWLSNQVSSLLEVLPQLRRFNPRSIVSHINEEPPLAGETFFEDIIEIQPGHFLSITKDGFTTSCYWRLEPQPLLRLATDDEYAGALRELLFTVAAEYTPPCRSGATVSSGLDSTTVTAAIHAVKPDADVTGFYWDTPELPEADESQYSLAVCEYLDIPSVPIRADLCWPLSATEGIKTLLLTPFYQYYTELWDTAFQRMRHDKICVAFSGAGGDHLFGGDVFAYPDLLLTGRWLELVRQVREHLPYSRIGFARIVRNMILRPIFHAYFPTRFRRPQLPVKWLGKKYYPLYQEHSSRVCQYPWMLPGRMQRFCDLRDPRLPQMIQTANLQAAAHQIEFRHPLLDHRLLEFAVSLPTTQSFRAAKRKIIVRNAMRGYLPDEILDMRRRIYASTIADRGLREREQAKVWALMTNMRAAELGFVDEQCLQQAYRDYVDGKSSTMFWHTLTLEDWLRRYF